MIVERATMEDYDAVRELDRLLKGVRDRGEALRIGSRPVNASSRVNKAASPGLP